MIKVLIADDHPIFRAGIIKVLENDPYVTALDEANDGEEVLDKISKKKFDLVLLDISMPGRSGLEILKLIKYQAPDLPVLILSMHPEKQYAVRAMKSGASGYLTKASASSELKTAIRNITNGRKYISASLAQILASVLDENIGKLPHETLSDREYEVLCMIAFGKTRMKIAEELCLSVKTVSTYRTRILEKMNMNSNAELVNYVMQNQLTGS